MRRLAPLLLCTLLALGLRAQVVMEEIGTLQESFTAAQQAFAAYQFPKAMAALDPLIATLTRWEQAGRLQPSDEALLEKSLELRGVCAYNVGKLDIARQDFTRLVQLRPEYPFSVTKAPKIQRFFEDLRSSLTGTLDLSVEPPESEVALDGRSLGTGNPRALPILKGLHILRVTHPGYDSVDREVNVEVGATSSLTVKLVPNARTIYFFVQPEGTELYVDGRLAGRAEHAASTSEAGVRFLQENGLDPKGLYFIRAAYLSPGDHKVTLKRQCFKGREFLLTVALDKVNDAPGFIRPITLEHRVVRMEVTSHPSGSRVVVDGQSLGDTPVSVAAFCIGRHDFVLQKPGVGEYRAVIDVPDASPFRLEATLRPSLLWVGWTRNQEVTPDQLQSATDAFLPAFQALTQFNAAVADERNPLLPDTFFTPGVGALDQAAAVKDLCARYACQGLVSGKLNADSGRFSASLRLFVPGLPGYDEEVKDVSSPEGVTALLTWLDRPLLRRPASQVLTLADLPGAEGPTFVRGLGIPNGPAAGDVLLAVDGTATPTAAAARTALDGALAPALKLSHRGQDRIWALKPDDLLEVTPYGGVSYGYRRQWLLGRQAVLGSESPTEKLYALMSVACAELNLGRPAEALKALEAADPSGAGTIGPAAVGYLKAVALVQLGRTEEARPLLMAAAGDGSGSLDGLGQVLLQPLAADLLRQMPPAPAPPAPTAPVKK